MNDRIKKLKAAQKADFSTSLELIQMADFNAAHAIHTIAMSSTEATLVHEALSFYWMQGKHDYNVDMQTLCFMFESIRSAEEDGA